MVRQFPVTTLCGSMRFWPEILQAGHDLTEQGYIVLMPLVHVIGPEEQATSNTKKMLDEMHFRKIDMSETIHVISKGAAMRNSSYVGLSTRKEIHYAQEHGKEVIYVGR